MSTVRSNRRYIKRFIFFTISIFTIYILYISLSCIGRLLCFMCVDKFKGSPLLHLNFNYEQRLRELGINTSSHTANLLCVHPVLELWHPDMRQYFHGTEPLTCSPEEDWVYVKNGTFHIYSEAIRKHGEISCEYLPQRRGIDDFNVINGISIRPMEDGAAIRSDFFRATCNAADGSQYTNLHLGIAYKTVLHHRSVGQQKNKPDKDTDKLNILMFGLDSTSRMSWLRNMPKSHQYFTTHLGGVVMEGYNIVGDGTPQALLPILTGYNEQVLPEARREKSDAQYVDNHPWIWKDLKSNGYITQWGEDGASMGTFTYRMLGFKDQPVDHYLRPFYLLAEKEYQNHPDYCLGSTPRHMNMLNWIRDLYEMYPNHPKFSFLFHSEYTHDSSNQLKVLDADMLRFLKDFEAQGYLNNTLLILMADHGARFQKIRRTVQGKYEERLPLMSFRLPPWFFKKYPQKVKNLFLNAKRLTTPYDIYATLRDLFQIGSVQKLSNEYQELYGPRQGISLFDLVPPTRTCEDAGIEAHWCACLTWQLISLTDNHVTNSARQLVETINTITSPKYDLCARLELTNILSAVTYTPNSNLLRFKSSKDVDGRIPDLTGDMTVPEVFYQVTIQVQPGGGMFEATVRYSRHNDVYHISDHDISRINKYGSHPDCVQARSPQLRPFCYCIHQGKSSTS